MHQMAAADLPHAFVESGDGTGKTTAEDVGESEVDHQAAAGETEDKPELLLHQQPEQAPPDGNVTADDLSTGIHHVLPYETTPQCARRALKY